MQRAIPLKGLPVGRTWKHSFTVEGMQTSSLEVSVYLCHVQKQVPPNNPAAALKGSYK